MSTHSTRPDVEQGVIEAITPVFREVFEDEDLVITRELDARQVENWDSLNHITLIVELEQVAGIQFTTDEIASMANVGDLIDCLIRKGFSGDG
jgi:acyl carrier protein